MTIDMTHFTPASSVLGGCLIGLAAAMLLVFNGRIAGISGILGGLRPVWCSDVLWRLAFVAGLVGAPWVYKLFALWPEMEIEASWGRLVAAGLLVGVGTRLGSGCTSGHGVCGLARLSPRALAAVVSFMAAGFLTVGLLRHGFAP